MSRISNCPRCDRRVSLPESAEPTAEVECPLCEARFPLAEVLEAAESVPELLLVGAENIAESELSAEPLSAEAALGGTGMALQSGAGDADEVVSVLTADELSDEVSDDVLASDTIVGGALPSAGVGSPEAVETGPVGFAIHADEADAGERSLSQRARSGPPQRGRKPKSAVRELIGIVVGGVGGLLIAYYCLNLFGGAQFDMLKIPLPFVPHTYQHWPGAKGESDATEETADEAQAANRQREHLPDTHAPEAAPAGELAMGGGGFGEMAPADPVNDLPLGYVGPLNPQFATPREVTSALQAALKASGVAQPAERVAFEGAREMNGRLVKLRRTELVGDEGASAVTVDKKAYQKLADLAAKATFLQSDEDAKLAEVRDKLAAALTRLASAEEAIAPFAQQQLDRGEEGGVVLMGNVGEIVQSGPYYGFSVQLTGTDRAASIFTDLAPELNQGDHVALMGRVVPSPQQNLPDYAGDEPAVVWLGPLAKLP